MVKLPGGFTSSLFSRDIPHFGGSLFRTEHIDEQELEKLLAEIRCTHHPRILDSIAQPFLINLGYSHPSFAILHEEGIFSGRVSLIFRGPTRNLRSHYGGYPYGTKYQRIWPSCPTDIGIQGTRLYGLK